MLYLVQNLYCPTDLLSHGSSFGFESTEEPVGVSVQLR